MHTPEQLVDILSTYTNALAPDDRGTVTVPASQLERLLGVFTVQQMNAMKVGGMLHGMTTDVSSEDTKAQSLRFDIEMHEARQRFGLPDEG